ncbi:hypothetical protein EJB05_53459, partial [Eragrostis curvula]
MAMVAVTGLGTVEAMDLDMVAGMVAQGTVVVMVNLGMVVGQVILGMAVDKAVATVVAMEEDLVVAVGMAEVEAMEEGTVEVATQGVDTIAVEGGSILERIVFVNDGYQPGIGGGYQPPVIGGGYPIGAHGGYGVGPRYAGVATSTATISAVSTAATISTTAIARVRIHSKIRTGPPLPSTHPSTWAIPISQPTATPNSPRKKEKDILSVNQTQILLVIAEPDFDLFPFLILEDVEPEMLPMALARSRSTTFCTFPVAVLGSSCTNTTVRGAMYRGSLARQNAIISSAVTLRSPPSLSLTNAHGVSPQNSWGRPTTAASATAGCANRAASTSIVLTFSPPETTMSLDLSTIFTYPSPCRTARSPDRSHPPASASAVAAASL